MENWLRIFLLFGGCLALLLGPICAINRFPLKNKSKNKDPPKPKPKPPRINEAILPSLKDFLEEVNLSEYFRDFVRMGFVDTKHCLRLQDMDYRLMQYDWPDMTTEKINRLKESVKGEMILLTAILLWSIVFSMARSRYFAPWGGNDNCWRIFDSMNFINIVLSQRTLAMKSERKSAMDVFIFLMQFKTRSIYLVFRQFCREAECYFFI